MNAIQALVESRKKYFYSADNPRVTLARTKYSNCMLCRHADILDPGGKECNTCPMFGHWPGTTKLERECASPEGAWHRWSMSSLCSTNVTPTYDRAFFALLLAEAFQARIFQIYKDR